ncbi:MAG: SDR family NAD(P)-dependent oxidoreductase [Spirochaetaceae bacterium]|nr:MAG: SDR family NAD(P)-dependent oxidoreductase [Spirochaetaceae bacterium]
MGFVEERSVLITGANSGIGFETARELARRRARVLMVARDRQRGERALANVLGVAERCGAPSPELLIADLTDTDQVTQLIDGVRARHSRLSVLINNAGGYFAHRSESSEGFEYTWALNVVAPIRLALGLLDLMTESSPARIVNVASHAHTAGRLVMEDLQMEEGKYRGFLQYARAKSALILWTEALARRVNPETVTACSVHPGWIRTGFGAANRGSATAAAFRFFTMLFAAPTVAGARPIVQLADTTSADGESACANGRYYFKSRRQEPAPHARDAQLADRLWELGLTYKL